MVSPGSVPRLSIDGDIVLIITTTSWSNHDMQSTIYRQLAAIDRDIYTINNIITSLIKTLHSPYTTTREHITITNQLRQLDTNIKTLKRNRRHWKYLAIRPRVCLMPVLSEEEEYQHC